MRFEGKIYTPNNTFLNLSTSQKWYWSGVLSFLLFCFLAIENQDNWKDDFLGSIFHICGFISLFVFALGKFGAIGSDEKLNGKLDGEIIITPDLICVNSQEFPLANIDSFNLNIEDFWGKYENPSFTIDPSYMAGINNKVEFNYKNKRISIQFRIDLEKEFVELKKIKEVIQIKKASIV
jgi:hypothetical protein